MLSTCDRYDRFMVKPLGKGRKVEIVVKAGIYTSNRHVIYELSTLFSPAIYLEATEFSAPMSTSVMFRPTSETGGDLRRSSGGFTKKPAVPGTLFLSHSPP